VLLLDEPTSGLDSFTANKLMNTLLDIAHQVPARSLSLNCRFTFHHHRRRRCQHAFCDTRSRAHDTHDTLQGRTVICTIHQPRSEMMSTFDLVLLLSKGEVVYFGEARDILAYFDELGYVCPSHVNPADYFRAPPSPRAKARHCLAYLGSSILSPPPPIRAQWI
jgi:hypothetical protein